jgi:hypothetical protein
MHHGPLHAFELICMRVIFFDCTYMRSRSDQKKRRDDVSRRRLIMSGLHTCVYVQCCASASRPCTCMSMHTCGHEIVAPMHVCTCMCIMYLVYSIHLLVHVGHDGPQCARQPQNGAITSAHSEDGCRPSAGCNGRSSPCMECPASYA